MDKKFDLDKTSIPSQYSINLKDNYAIGWLDCKTCDMYRVLFTAIGYTLRAYQRKNAKRIGLSFKDKNGNWKMGAILNFIDPEAGAEEDSGNWYLELTFDSEDMANLDIDVDNYTDIFIESGVYAASSCAFGRFRSTELMYDMFDAAIDTLKQFLDVNASEEGEVEVTLRGIFTASVIVENGIKIMSIVPGESIKQLIKNDAAL